MIWSALVGPPSPTMFPASRTPFRTSAARVSRALIWSASFFCAVFSRPATTSSRLASFTSFLLSELIRPSAFDLVFPGRRLSVTMSASFAAAARTCFAEPVSPSTRPRAIHRPCAFVTFEGLAIPKAFAIGPGMTLRAQPMILALIQPPIAWIPDHRPWTTLRPFSSSSEPRLPRPALMRPGRPEAHWMSWTALAVAPDLMRSQCRKKIETMFHRRKKPMMAEAMPLILSQIHPHAWVVHLTILSQFFQIRTPSPTIAAITQPTGPIAITHAAAIRAPWSRDCTPISSQAPTTRAPAAT